MCQCGGASEHEHRQTTETIVKSLFSYILSDRLTALNIKNPSALPHVLREHYFSDSAAQLQTLESDTDNQIIVNVFFAGTVKVKAIELSGDPSDGPFDTWPREVKIFVNTPRIDFTNVNALQPAQTLTLATPSSLGTGPLRYSLRAAKFFNANSLTLFFPASFNARQLRLGYIGFEGEFTQTRIGPVNTTYESKPQIVDHTTEDLFATTSRSAF